MNKGDRAGCLKGPLIPVSPSLVGGKRERTPGHTTVPGTLRARKHGQGLLFVLPSKQDWPSFYQRTLQSCSLAWSINDSQFQRFSSTAAVNSFAH